MKALKAPKLFFLLVAMVSLVGIAFNIAFNVVGRTEAGNSNLLFWLVVFVVALLCTMLTTKKPGK